ncbi:hypothetical protein H4Q26_007662 [Puccinia striiformis f. sp. tritici PST-130]|nr:hypothetical protein H4Q26_007662 [Puccinia striiformis f. sp. tritici PST-130]
MRFIFLLAVLMLLVFISDGQLERLEGTREAMRVGMQKRGSSSFVKKLTKGLKAGSPGKDETHIPNFHEVSRDTAKVPVDKKSDDPTSKNNEPSENRPASSEAEEKTTTATKEEDKKDKSSPVSTLVSGAKKAFAILKPDNSKGQNESTGDLFDTSTLPKFKTEEPDSVKEEAKVTEPSTSD